MEINNRSHDIKYEILWHIVIYVFQDPISFGNSCVQTVCRQENYLQQHFFYRISFVGLGAFFSFGDILRAREKLLLWLNYVHLMVISISIMWYFLWYIHIRMLYCGGFSSKNSILLRACCITWWDNHILIRSRVPRRILSLILMRYMTIEKVEV